MDLSSEQLWDDAQAIAVTPKAWAVLRYLVERPGQLVTKAELLDAVWGEVNVGDGSLTRVIFELRSVFGDTALKSRFIQTVHRRGFRFIAPLEPATDSPQTSRPASDPAADEKPYISRQRELQQLHDWFALALAGQRQTVFITGEPGIGKTALVDAFIKHLGAPCLIGFGQCIDQYGPREAFMPVLEALGRWCRQPGGERVVDILRRHAPTWLTEIPGLLEAGERDALQRQTAAVTAARMLRVMVEALEVMSAETPVVLVLEDLHWGDFSTLDLLSALAYRREPARLMVLATYRPVDAVVQGHPVHEVKQALELHDRCRVLTVDPLRQDDVLTYLHRCLGPNQFPEALAKVLHRHTDGNPLFLSTAIQYLCGQGLVALRDGVWQLTVPLESVVLGVPETLRQLIRRRYEQLAPEERTVLDAASVAGHTIAAPAVAAALEQDSAAVEATCTRLARRELFLRQLESCAWPDATRAAQYRFTHSLYERAVYDELAPKQREQWHRRIAERIEAGHCGDTAAIAAELAAHFETAGAHEKCIPHLEQAATNASRRFADQEAIGYVQRALQCLQQMPDTPERTEREVSLLMSLGGLQFTTQGYGSKAAHDSYTRMLSLCREKEATPQVLPALGGVTLYHLNQGELGQAQQFAEQMLDAAERLPLPSEVLAYSRAPLVLVLFYRGQLDAAVACMEEGIELCDPTQYSFPPHVWSDQGVSMLSYLSIALLLHGRPQEAIARSGQAIERARTIGREGSIAHAYCFAAVMYYFLRDWRRVEELGAAAVEVAEDNGLRFWMAQARAIHGAGLAQTGRVDDGIASLRAGYSEMRAAGGIATGTYVRCMTAEALMQVGRLDEADEELSEAFALAERTDERFAEPELCRNRGAIVLLRGASSTGAGKRSAAAAQAEATGWIEKAISLAQAQGARWWELRSTISLYRLWTSQGREREARQRLQQVLAQFPKGLSMVDLVEAAAAMQATPG